MNGPCLSLYVHSGVFIIKELLLGIHYFSGLGMSFWINLSTVHWLSLIIWIILCLCVNVFTWSSMGKWLLQKPRSTMHAKSLSHVQLHGLFPIRLLCLQDFPGKNTEVGCHFLLQGIFPTQGSNQGLLHWQVDSLLLSHQAITSATHWAFINISQLPDTVVLPWLLLKCEAWSFYSKFSIQRLQNTF